MLLGTDVRSMDLKPPASIVAFVVAGISQPLPPDCRNAATLPPFCRHTWQTLMQTLMQSLTAARLPGT